jgi:hypothetical protein
MVTDRVSVTNKDLSAESELEMTLKIKSVFRYIPLFALLVSLVFNILQYLNNKSQKRQYEERLEPQIDCFYRYYADSSRHELVIKNVSLADSKDVWANEEIFVVVNNEVFEGQDIPHYNYVVYNGSRTRMWDLKRGEQIELSQVEHQALALVKLTEKLYPMIISRWSLSYSSVSTSKRYRVEKYFLYDPQEGLFKEIGVDTGHESVLNRVRDYLSVGKSRSINIFDLTGDFEIDAPKSYLIDSSYSVRPLYPWSKVTIREFNESRLFSPGEYEIQPSDDVQGSICYFWEYKDGKWDKGVIFTGKGPFYSKPMQLPLAYLAKDEAEQVQKNPKLLKYFDNNRKAPNESIEQVLEKARIKYLKERQNTQN